MSDSSECSADSPQLYIESPYSSPSQQVPHVTNAFYGLLSFADNDNNKPADGNGPYLSIIEQPQNHFRFRYKSEMIGTHGCLLGQSYSNNRTKTHPTVELVNYGGKAVIRCRLAQFTNDEEHPHKLLEDDLDKEVKVEVPEQGSYKVGFPGMGIIHTAKKDVPNLLFKKYSSRMNNKLPFDPSGIRVKCENMAKTINLNIVRLRFSAHDPVTNRDICPPVYSEPIHNLKSAATNDVKICRMSRLFGRPRGGDDVYILVEKVNKKNIEIRFYELSDTGEEVWSAKGHFLQSDVHHQYAIVFRTPAYRDLEITRDVKVFIELRRPSDGRTSDSKEFTYRADQVMKQSKKRRANSSYSSFESNTGSLKSVDELPTTVINHNNTIKVEDAIMSDVSMFTMQTIPQTQPVSGNTDPFAEALFSGVVSGPTATTVPDRSMFLDRANPMLGQPNVPQSMPSFPGLSSNEFNQLLNDNNILPEDKQMFCEANFEEYFRSNESLPPEDAVNSMEFIRALLVSDSGKAKTVKVAEPSSSDKNNFNETKFSSSNESVRKPNLGDNKQKSNNEYTAFYKSEDGARVKQLVKELCDIMKNRTTSMVTNQKELVRFKLEQLFEIRLSNGDTFLHLTLCSNQPTMEYIIKMIHSLKMTHLLNLTNNLQQTILHLAVLNDMPKLVPFLLSRGCNPSAEDSEGNTPVHYAVTYQSCLAPLLDAVRTFNVSCDLNAYNCEKQTALHLAALHKSANSVRLLTRSGASLNARDLNGRTPLHLAAYDDCLPVAAALLDATHASDVDAIDGSGNTALQIACDGEIREYTLSIIKLLLDKKADPMKHEDNNYSAWKIVRDKPQIRSLMMDYINVPMNVEIEVKSEPEDDYESAEEDDSEVCLQHLSRYIHEISPILDASGAWMNLAVRLRQDSLISWYANTSSPTATLLNHVKECEESISTKSLALILFDMGQSEAANIIRRHVD